MSVVRCSLLLFVFADCCLALFVVVFVSCSVFVVRCLLFVVCCLLLLANWSVVVVCVVCRFVVCVVVRRCLSFDVGVYHFLFVDLRMCFRYWSLSFVVFVECFC